MSGLTGDLAGARRASAKFRALMRREGQLWERAITTGVGGTGGALRDDWRRQIVSAGLGRRLSKAVQLDVYPERKIVSADAAAVVWTKADRILTGHEDGSLIRPTGGTYLAIPLPAAEGRLPGNKAPTPREFELRRGIDLFPVKVGGNLFLAGEGRLTKSGRARRKAKLRVKSGAFGKGATTIFLFQLVKQVQLPDRLSLAEAVPRVTGGLDRAIIRAYDRLNE